MTAGALVVMGSLVPGVAPEVAGAADGVGRPTSPYGTSVVIDGHGNGHGIGLSQYGALGYAIDHGWNSDQILAHYYGGTTAGSIANDVISVRLTDLDDRPTAVVGTSLTIPTAGVDPNPQAWKSVYVLPDTNLGARGAQVWAHPFLQLCPAPTDDLVAGGWTRLNDQGDIQALPVDVAAANETPTTAPTDLAALCEPDGTVRSYRGLLRATTGTANERRTVNVVPIESYLRGVVPSEMPAGWAGLGAGKGMEALEAQAVAARSYARLQSRYSYAQTCDTQSCQVYDGAARRPGPSGALTGEEEPNTDTAITATAGQVRLTSTGAVANTMFSSSSGGYTTPSVSPGFPAVLDEGDDVAQNPHYNWQATVPVSTIEQKWPTIGVLTQITVTERNGLGRDGGRVLSMAVIGNTGRVTITGDAFRIALGLKSNWFTVRGDQCSGRVEPTVTGVTVPTTALGMVPIAPVRVIDTRNGIGTTAIPLGGGCTLAFDPGTRPTGTAAAAIVITTTRADGNGFTTAYPCGGFRPEVSAVQILGGLDIPGTTVVPLGTSGQICIYSSVTTDVLIDVMGWLAPSGAAYTGTASPVRLLDTRQPVPTPRPAARTSTIVQVPSTGGVIPSTASINLTATGATESGFVTAYPCDQAVSETSVVNFRAGVDIANHVFVDLDAQGRFCLWNSAPVHLIADLDGVFGPAAGSKQIRVQAPERVIDSRSGVGTTGVLRAGVVRELDLGAASGGVLAQFTIVDPGAAGFVTVYPCDDATRGGGTSAINAPRSTNVANVVLMRTDTEGRVCIVTTMTAHVLVDVIGRV